MTMLIDTHTHLYLPDFSDDQAEMPDAVERAVAAGVGHMIFPNVDLTTVDRMHSLAARHADVVSMAMGLHPTEIGESWRDDLDLIMEILADGNKYVAVGEVGIDLYWDRTFVEAQMMAFERQADSAVRLGLPLIIHCRDGQEQALEVLQGFRGVTGVFHSFGGSPRDVDDIRRVGDFYFGINGIVTFKNSRLRETLPAIGLDRILLETDSPYLAPVPYRGKRNESAYLTLIAATIADSLGLTETDIASKTTANARSLFGIR